MEQTKEDLRTELIIGGLEAEMRLESSKAWLAVVNGLHQVDTDGKIIGGPGLEVKMESYYDYIDALKPWQKITRPKSSEPTPENEDDERLKLVEEYKQMVSSGLL